jgi:hypothetical protein
LHISKIHFSSLPRRREPSQINKLDSRLRGNDEFLEIPFISSKRAWIFVMGQSLLEAVNPQWLWHNPQPREGN